MRCSQTGRVEENGVGSGGVAVCSETERVVVRYVVKGMNGCIAVVKKVVCSKAERVCPRCGTVSTTPKLYTLNPTPYTLNSEGCEECCPVVHQRRMRVRVKGLVTKV